jgi:hypothetical protein
VLAHGPRQTALQVKPTLDLQRELTVLRSQIAIGLVVTILVGATRAEGNCIWPSPERAADHATVVFAGIVKSVVDHPKDSWPCFYTTEFVFQVSQVWKGPLWDEIGVCVIGDSSFERYNYEIGRHYIVYAMAKKWCGDLLITHECARPQLVEEALWDRVVLGKAKVVNAYTAVPVPSESEVRSVLNRGGHTYGASEALKVLQKKRTLEKPGECE